MTEHAQALVSGQLRRLVVTQPPGTYKSRTWTVNLPAWSWLSRPGLKYIIGSNEEGLSIRDSLLCRKLIRSGWYRNTFLPAWAISGDQDAKKLFTNTEGGSRQITSSGASVVGKKADVILVDDLHDAAKVHRPAMREADKFWFFNALYDRQQDFTKSSIAVIAHPLHPQDITRELIARGWPHLNLVERMEGRHRKIFPLGGTDPRAEGEYLRPSRFGPAQEKDVKDTSGELVWEAKHQGAPRTAEGTMFPKDKPNILAACPAGTVGIRYWDTAATTGDTSAHTSGVWIGRTPANRWVIADVTRGKWTWAERDKQIKNAAELDRWAANRTTTATWVEHPGGSGGVQTGEILVASMAGYSVFIDPVSGRGDKVTRAGPLSAQWQAGNVDLVAGPWNAAYLDRMEAFPGLPDKDDTDASSGGFNKIALGNPNAAPPVAKPNPIDALPKGTLRTGRIDPRTVGF